MTLLLALWISGFAFGLNQLSQYILDRLNAIDGTNYQLKKPFSCPPCISFWTGLFLAIAEQDYLLIFIPFLITKIVSRYLWS